MEVLEQPQVEVVEQPTLSPLSSSTDSLYQLPDLGDAVSEYFVYAEYYAPGPEAAAVEVVDVPPAPGPPGPPGPAAPAPPAMPDAGVPELPPAVPGVPDLPPEVPDLRDWEVPLYRAWSTRGGSIRGGRYWARKARQGVTGQKK